MEGKALPIVYASPYYDPNVPSGANRRFDEICKRLLEDYGDTFTLIVARGRRPSWWSGKNLIEVDYRFDHSSKFRAAREIGRAIDSLPPSIVILESIPIPLRALQRHRHFQTAYDFRYFHAFSKNFLYRTLFSNYLKYEWRRSGHIITCSEFSIDELEKHVGYPRERVVKSFFGINEKIFDVPRNQVKEYDIIYVGHFDKHKNHVPLIDALALVDKNLKVLFVGVDNGLQASLEVRAKGCGLRNVLFKTVRNETEVWKLYTKSRIFVSPSLYEGFGMPTIEALALGLPIVLSDIPVFHEVGGDLATYFDPHNPHDIAEKLRTALAHPEPPSPERAREHLKPYVWAEIYRTFVADIRRLSSRT